MSVEKLKKKNLAAAVLLLLLLTASSGEVPDRGLITVVYDGDTIGVRLDSGDFEKVRLIGIDAPELGDDREMVRYQAEISKRFAYSYLHRRKTRLTYDWEKRDKYGRLLAYVWTEDGMFNEIILRRGYASVFLKFPFKNEYRVRFKKAESLAREEKSGLWKDFPYPVVDAHEAGCYLRRMCAVRFRCGEIVERKNYILLKEKSGRFSAFIYRKDMNGFPRLETLKNKRLRVSGMIEDYRGNPQMVLFSPLQLQENGER